MSTRDTTAVPTQPPAGEVLAPVDVVETPAGLVLAVELAGVPRDAVEVRIERGELIIRGRPAPPAAGDWRTAGTEWGPEVLTCRMELPADMDRASVTASLQQGVLTVKIPRKASAQPRKVPVREFR